MLERDDGDQIEFEPKQNGIFPTVEWTSLESTDSRLLLVRMMSRITAKSPLRRGSTHVGRIEELKVTG